MKKNEKGFGALEALLIIVIIGLLGLAGWMFFSKQNDKNINSATKTTQSTPKNENNTKTTAEESTKTAAKWQKYTNAKYKFGYSYPEGAKITEREDAQFFETTAIRDNGNNPALNVWGNGNYKVQVQAYQYDQTLTDFLKTYGKKATVSNVNGLDKASVDVSSEETQGPSYTEYYFGKSGTILSLVVVGDFPYELKDLLDSVYIN